MEEKSEQSNKRFNKKAAFLLAILSFFPFFFFFLRKWEQKEFQLPPAPTHLFLDKNREEREGKIPLYLSLLFSKVLECFYQSWHFLKPFRVRESTTAFSPKLLQGGIENTTTSRWAAWEMQIMQLGGEEYFPHG